MKNITLKVLQIISVISATTGTLAMFIAKLASANGGFILYRTETHWFNDSITSFLLSIICILFSIQIIYNKNNHQK
jgi:hypothetical protein